MTCLTFIKKRNTEMFAATLFGRNHFESHSQINYKYALKSMIHVLAEDVLADIVSIYSQVNSKKT